MNPEAPIPKAYRENNKYAWDHGADYEKSTAIFEAKIKAMRGKKGIRARRTLAYSAVLLIQLRNASRISEAYDMTKYWIETGNRENSEIMVRKHGEQIVKRLMVLPKILTAQDRIDIRSVLLTRPLKKEMASIKMFAIRNIGFNSHSFRYAGITNMGERRLAPQVIAKITGHTDLNFIIDYTQQKKAEEILREL